MIKVRRGIRGWELGCEEGGVESQWRWSEIYRKCVEIEWDCNSVRVDVDLGVGAKWKSG